MAISRFLIGGVASALLLTGGLFMWKGYTQVAGEEQRARNAADQEPRNRHTHLPRYRPLAITAPSARQQTPP